MESKRGVPAYSVEEIEVLCLLLGGDVWHNNVIEEENTCDRYISKLWSTHD